MKQMSRQEYRGSAGEYQADEQAGVVNFLTYYLELLCAVGIRSSFITPTVT